MAKRTGKTKTRRADGNPAEAAAGSNGGPGALTDDERAALHFKHKKEYEDALAVKKKADADFKNVGKRIKAEGGSVAQIKISIALETPEGEQAFKDRLRSEIEVAQWNGVGVQLGLFGEDDRTPAVDRAFQEGKRAGMQAGPRKPPHDPSVPQYKAWLDGYDVGQEANRTAFVKQSAPIEPDAEQSENGNGATLDSSIAEQAAAAMGEDGTDDPRPNWLKEKQESAAPA